MSNLATYDYTPYGDILQQSGLPLDVGFTGHHWDSHIQQYFAPFRFYAPETMRWLKRDPLGMVDGPLPLLGRLTRAQNSAQILMRSQI